MEREELTRIWREAGGASGAAQSATPEERATLFGAPACALDDLLGTDLAVLGLPLGGRSDAPAAIRAASLRYGAWVARAAAETGLRVADYGDVPVDAADRAATFVRAHERLADILAAGAAPIVLGGDAVVTTPVLQVLAGKMRGRLGVIALSPRLDLEIEGTGSAAGRWALALELGVCEPGNVVLIGERGAPLEAPARRVARELGVHCYSVADVWEAGIVTVAREALAAAAAGAESVYVSVDLGVAEGVDDPVGLGAGDLSVALGIVCRARLAGADLCGLGSGTLVAGGAAGGAASLAARLAADLALATAATRA